MKYWHQVVTSPFMTSSKEQCTWIKSYLRPFASVALHSYFYESAQKRQSSREWDFLRVLVSNIPTYVLHHDPEVWNKPQEFNPDNFSPKAKQKRDPYSYLPFGTGPRQCIGMRLALLEIKQGLFKIMQRFKFERAPETVPVLEYRAVLIMAPKGKICVKIKAR